MNSKIYPVGWATSRGRVDIYSPEIIKLHKLAYNGDRAAQMKLEHLVTASRRIISEVYLFERKVVRIDLNIA